jgi:hypothetical protein
MLLALKSIIYTNIQTNLDELIQLSPAPMLLGAGEEACNFSHLYTALYLLLN